MKINNYLIIAFLACAQVLQAQDLHFSNTEYSPLILNPALAGANSGMQANLAYRTQWGQLGSSFRSAIASFDARVSNDKSGKKNFLALGLNLYNDRIGDMGLSSNSVALSIADHLRLDAKNQLSFALNIGYTMRSFDNVQGRWASQFDGAAFNPSLPSGEDVNNLNFGFLDAGAGLLYTYTRKVNAIAGKVDKRINVGVAAFHLNRPDNSFVEASNERLSVRYTAFANASISIDGTDGDVMPGIFYQRQGNFSQLMLGTMYRYRFNTGSNYTGYERPFSVSLGVYTRLRDALIARLMLDWDQFSLGYAYDFTVSPLTNNSNPLGASEIFVRFNIGDGGGFRYKVR